MNRVLHHACHLPMNKCMTIWENIAYSLDITGILQCVACCGYIMEEGRGGG